ncbi:MAG: tRNA preQ1(34) S-adenosylmethionine ribosyltransferase-isomerase QueA [Clostridia bacterium]|nr:tRNA preQ1(34) S-adenosylmethionine ribosyltransferase-isomerase QueA [Clostridia bacterium]
MKTSDFDYELPEELIAQTPVEPRDHSRLMVVHTDGRPAEHRRFDAVTDYLRAGDALVINETRVIPARLLGVKESTGVPVEVLLLRRLNATDWEALVRPGRRLKPGTVCSFGDGLLRCEIVSGVEEIAGRVVRFHYEGVFEELLDRLGEMPLPPYIHEKLRDRERYQTVYAKTEGSAAAPTAGLHFTPALLDRIRDMGVTVVPVLLHVGLGTFRPVKAENLEEHRMHSEWYQVTEEAARTLNRVRAAGGRLICVGTTSVRTIETVADDAGVIHAGCGETAIFIHPGVRIKAVDGLITNFHLPQSTLLMLVSAFLGRERALAAYREAVAMRYRFFSFGDAMFIDSQRAPFLIEP